ncbi:MAG: hypothetical protein KAH57_07805, partial [Thermoplasmata archaeon]|nr:hypothetical protein [Thermoplasmata archaeon]
DYLILELNVTDNIKVTKVILSGYNDPISGMSYNITVAQTGEFNITITAFDQEGNSNSTWFLLRVLETDHDSDGDGIPDKKEETLGLDPYDATDSEYDPDLDGLTNYQEYENGTDLYSDDSDYDGLDDLWEVQYGFDPNRFSRNEDPDGDGRDNYEEYLSGTDPLVDDTDEEGSSFQAMFLIIMLVIIALLSSLIIVNRKLISKTVREFIKQRKAMDWEAETPPDNEMILPQVNEK